MKFENGTIAARGITLGNIVPLIDGVVPDVCHTDVSESGIVWTLDTGDMTLTVEHCEQLGLTVVLDGAAPVLDSLGLRFGAVRGLRRYLRGGYHSWDGSGFEVPGTPTGDGPPGKAPTLGQAMTALLPQGGGEDGGEGEDDGEGEDGGEGAVVIGFTRHDRFQSRLRFGGSAAAPTIDIETLWDRVAHEGRVVAEPIVVLEGDAVEPVLRDWARIVAAASPLPPSLPTTRITGWSSWYNLYAAIDEPVLREHLHAAAAFRNAHAVPLDVFQVDDGFTPEMGDWLDFRPTFPNGVAPLLAEAAALGFTPGLWIAPFMVGNRSRLAREHPDWLVADATTGAPLVQMRFYGEFRWHKRSEEYHILDITHPAAEAYIRRVFRTWHDDWGARYFKVDFLLFGSEHGPATACWHTNGLSRIAIWRRMMSAIREETHGSRILGCGCPLWASIGLVEGMRIGRDVGTVMRGDYSAETLLGDVLTRNYAGGILWQADPDCVLLRDRFHDYSDAQQDALLAFASGTGGVLMTSDHFGELSPARAALFAAALRDDVVGCDFPRLGSGDAVVQRVHHRDGRVEERVVDL